MIQITKTNLGKEELKEVEDVLKSGWAVRGEKTAELERLVSEYTGSKYVLATTSCTTALHLALLALGIGKGDEVIVPAFTWVATANVVEMVGATPIFCDISISTYNIDTDLIEGLITDKTKAIIPVHLFGLSADMNPIMKLARKHKLKVIEDAACSLGTLYEKKHTGTIGDIGCFSLHPRKSITTGEGGFITTNNKKLYDLMFRLHDHGGPNYDILGYNYRMNDIQGAVGVAQMKKLKRILAERLKGAEYYSSKLDEDKKPFIPEYSNHSYQSYVILIHDRDKIMKHLAGLNISTRFGTQCVSDLPYYKKKYGAYCPVARMANKYTLTLPLYVGITEKDQNKVLEGINELQQFSPTE